jgi:hypothetical protein
MGSPVESPLVVVSGRMRGAGFDIPPGRSEIGRQAGVAIPLDDQDVSRRHASWTAPAAGSSWPTKAGQVLAGLRLTEAERAGALAAAGARVVESIARVAHWLGPVAAGVLARL